MNKKFLLLPLVAMTASVYATQQEAEFIKITDQSTGLTTETIDDMAGNLNPDTDLYKITSEGKTNSISINKNKQIEALTALIEDYKKHLTSGSDPLSDIPATSSKNFNETTDEILKSLTYEYKPTPASFTFDTISGKIIVTPEIKTGETYAQIKEKESLTTTLNSLKAELNYVIPKIKNQKLFYNEHGSEEIEITNGLTKEKLDEIVTKLINDQHIDIQRYKANKKKIDSLPEDHPFKNTEFKHDINDELDTNSTAVKVLQAHDALLVQNTELQKQNKELKQEIQDEKEKLETKIKQLEEDKENTKKQIDGLNDQLQQEQNKEKAPQMKTTASRNLYQMIAKNPNLRSLNLEKAQLMIDEIVNATGLNYRNQLTIQGKTANTTQVPTKNDFTNEQKIILKMNTIPNTVSISTVINNSKQITFGRAIKPTSIENFTQLYQDVANILKIDDPTQWKEDNYIKAITQLIKPNTITKYGLIINEGSNFDNLLKDLKTFNLHQRTKYIYCYLNKTIR